MYSSVLPIMRSGQKINNIIQVVGKPSETDLTAFLGWLIANAPCPCGKRA